jgi:two-component system chemotaxis response regulator CheY
MKALVVEDDFTSRILLQAYLARYGECQTATSTSEAVEAFRLAAETKQPYNLVCVDIRMPGTDGMQLVKQLRDYEEQHGVSFHFGAKIFMTTALHDAETVFASFRSLCDEYLVKPIDIALLSSHLHSHRLAGPAANTL